MSVDDREKTIDVSGLSSPKELHALLSASLGFPNWYGHNWDAFMDCISDQQLSHLPQSLRISGMSSLAAVMPREAELFQQCLSAMAAESPSCRVSWA